MSQSGKPQGISFTVIVLSAIVSVILGVFFAKTWSNQEPEYQYKGTVLSEGRNLKPFDFPTTDSKHFSSKTVKGHWTFVFYGFTHCQMMCPTAMNELRQVYRKLQESEVKNLPEVVMVTIDPERDSVKRMREYVKGFNPKFVGAVGTKQQVVTMTREVGIAFEKVKSRDVSKTGDYDMQHSGAILVLNPKGKLQAFFNWPHKVDDIVEDYKHIIRS